VIDRRPRRSGVVAAVTLRTLWALQSLLADKINVLIVWLIVRFIQIDHLQRLVTEVL
jgi:hypothetical protein